MLTKRLWITSILRYIHNSQFGKLVSIGHGCPSTIDGRSSMSDSIQVSGVIEEIFDTHEFSEKFRKREFILEHAPNPQWPEHLKLEFINQKTDLLDQYNVGDNVVCDINLKGRKWENDNGSGYVVSLQCWRIAMCTEEQQDKSKEDYPF